WFQNVERIGCCNPDVLGVIGPGVDDVPDQSIAGVVYSQISLRPWSGWTRRRRGGRLSRWLGRRRRRCRVRRSRLLRRSVARLSMRQGRAAVQTATGVQETKKGPQDAVTCAHVSTHVSKNHNDESSDLQWTSCLIQ